VPEREWRAIERAAGLPGARLKANPERLKHRGGTRRSPPVPEPKEVVRQETLF
jgi:hypothetical protein